MISDIEDWLRSNPSDYQKGVLLYSKYGKSAALKMLFSGSESSLSKSKLKQELAKISTETVSKHPEAKIKAIPITDLTPNSESRYIHIDVVLLPDDLKEKNRRKTALFTQSKDLFSNIRIAETEGERYEIAKAIVENFDEIDEIWKELELFQSTGKRIDKSKSEKPISEMNGLEISKQLENVKKRFYNIRNEPTKKLHSDQLQLKIKELEDALQKR